MIIGFVIVIHFIFLSGQFPDGYFIKNVSQPIRKLVFDPILNLGFSGTINSIIFNISLCVIVPALLIFLISRQKSGYYINRITLKILFLLFILYLPVILFGPKPIHEIIPDLPNYLFIAAIPEEILYRGFLQSRIEKEFRNPTNAILLSSLIFGFMHLPINIKMYGEVTGIAACIGNNAFGGLFLGYLF